MGLAITRLDSVVFPANVKAQTPTDTDFASPALYFLSASSNDYTTEQQVVMGNANNFYEGLTATNIRIGQKINPPHTALTHYITQAKFYLQQFDNGSPDVTGNIKVVVRKVSDDSILGESAEYDTVNITTTITQHTFTFPNPIYLPNESLYILIEAGSGLVVSGRKELRVYHDSSSGGATEDKAYYTGSSYQIQTANVCRLTIVYIDKNTDKLRDLNTTTYWESNNETNPYITIDLGSEQFIAGLQIYWGLNGRPDNYSIQVSADNLNWENIITYNEKPAYDQNKNYTFPVRLKRYVRVIANQTMQLRMYEIKYYTQTANQLIEKHGHGGF